MSRRIDHSSDYPFPAEQVHSALTSEQYWRDRLAEVGGERATLDEITVGDGTIAVRMTQAIAEEHLPSIVSKVRPGDLIIKRSETWARLNEGIATGTFSASVEGAPAKISGSQRLTAEGSNSIVELEGEAVVKIPIIGGKIESAIADQVLQLNDKEREFTECWLSR